MINHVQISNNLYYVIHGISNLYTLLTKYTLLSDVEIVYKMMHGELFKN